MENDFSNLKMTSIHWINAFDNTVWFSLRNLLSLLCRFVAATVAFWGLFLYRTMSNNNLMCFFCTKKWSLFTNSREEFYKCILSTIDGTLSVCVIWETMWRVVACMYFRSNIQWHWGKAPETHDERANYDRKRANRMSLLS